MAKKPEMRLCKDPDCGEYFLVTRADKIYCDNKCRSNHHNQLKKLMELEEFPNEKAIRENATRLKALFEDPLYKNNVPESVISHERIDPLLYTEKIQNTETKRPILFCHQYGLEIIETIPTKIYKIHKK